jgi:hypothetical protein
MFWPKFFKVPDDEWEKYIDPYNRDSILCINCFNKIKRLIDSARVKKIDNIDARSMNTVWTNRLVAIEDICSLFKNNGYKPSIIENRKANMVILTLCEHGQLPPDSDQLQLRTVPTKGAACSSEYNVRDD